MKQGVNTCRSTVRVVKSKRAGIGKTLYKKRRVEDLEKLNLVSTDRNLSVSIPLYEKNVSMIQVADKLLPYTLKHGEVFPRIFHLNISYEVKTICNLPGDTEVDTTTFAVLSLQTHVTLSI